MHDKIHQVHATRHGWYSGSGLQSVVIRTLHVDAKVSRQCGAQNRSILETARRVSQKCLQHSGRSGRTEVSENQIADLASVRVLSGPIRPYACEYAFRCDSTDELTDDVRMNTILSGCCKDT